MLATLTDSTFESIQRRILKQAIIGKPTRTAMGEYIVPPGKKPLTSLARDRNPAPSDYSPKVHLTKPAPPQYSIAGPYMTHKADYHASPADNNTEQNMTWKCRYSSLKEKGTTRPYDVRDKAHINDSVGPLQYKVDYHDVGKDLAPKLIIGTMTKVHTGPPNRLVQPVDTHGVNNPAPNYLPESSLGQITIGVRQDGKCGDGPGPAEYTIQDIKDGPAYSLAKRLPPPLTWQQATTTDSPGPGAYSLETTIGKAQANSLGDRHSPPMKNFVPASNKYSLPDTIAKRDGATLTYRRFEPEDKPHPAANCYSVTRSNLRKAPTHSMAKRTKPCFPDILHYPLQADKVEPGPGSYNDDQSLQRSMLNNDGPKFSMGHVARKSRNEVPGPNHYRVNPEARPGAKKYPAFSMAKRITPIDKRVSPGPAAYNPKPSQSGIGYSMTSRRKGLNSLQTPAPNKYSLYIGQTRAGVYNGPAATFKSRASPYVFSGVQANKVC